MNVESDSILLRRMEFFHQYDIEVWLRKEVSRFSFSCLLTSSVMLDNQLNLLVTTFQTYTVFFFFFGLMHSFVCKVNFPPGWIQNAFSFKGHVEPSGLSRCVFTGAVSGHRQEDDHI